MIKRKAPFLLGTVVGTLVLTLIAINMTQYLRDPGGIQTLRPPNEEALKKARERQSQAVGAGGATLQAASAFGPEGVPGESFEGIPDEPSIRLPSLTFYTPTYEPGKTTPHWYKDDSYEKVSAEQGKGVRSDATPR